MLQPRQHNLLARLFNLSRQKHLIKYRVDFVEIEDQIQFAHIPEKLIKDLHEEVDSFKVCQLVIVRIDADTEEESSVAAVDYLGGR